MFHSYIQCIPKRFILIFMIFIGFINITVITSATSSKFYTNNSNIQFNWTSDERNLLIHSFNYGWLFSPLGGILAELYGGSTIYAITILLHAAIVALFPFLLQSNFFLFVAGNGCIALLEASGSACISQLWFRWSPPSERCRFISFSIVGVEVGYLISFLVTDYISERIKWHVLCYVSGGISFIWFCIWVLTVNDGPDKHKTITEQERKYIIESTNYIPTKKIIYPWRKIFTCLPFLAACISRFAFATSETFIVTYLSQYIKDTTNFGNKEIKYISTIPIVISTISLPIFGCLSDYIRKNEILSPMNFHKCFIFTGSLIGGITFMIINIWQVDLTTSIICISVYQFFSAMITIGLQLLLFDLAPMYVAFLNGCTITTHTISFILTQIYINLLVSNQARHEWNNCFATFSVIYFLASFCCLKYISAEPRSWANHQVNT